MKFVQMNDGGQIPVLGLGTWEIGGDTEPDYSRDDEMVDLLQMAMGMGYTHIDTAEYYARNHSEELIGRAMTDFDRDDLFIVSKVWPAHFEYDEVHRAMARTLKALDTDYVDLYLLHWPSQSVPLSETMRAMNEIVADGRAKRMGVSNFSVAQMKEAEELSNTPIVTNQVSYSLLDRKPVSNGVLGHCQQTGSILTAYSPIKGGVLSQPAVKEIAKDHGCSPAQVALQWLLRQPGVITIPKAGSEAHLRDNLAALDLVLTEEEVARLDSIRR